MPPPRTGHSREASLRRLYKSFIYTANLKNMRWELTLEEFQRLTSSCCHYCGVEPRQKRRNYTYNGLDRLDNHRGYFPANVVPCCGTCNCIKSDKLTAREMRVAMKAVVELRRDLLLASLESPESQSQAPQPGPDPRKAGPKRKAQGLRT